MNIEQFALKNGLSKYMTTYKEFYDTLVDILGYEEILKYVPYSLAQVMLALRAGDVCLNSLPLEKWDDMSGAGIDSNGKQYPNHKGLYAVYKKHGIDAYSQAEGVCILKSCAIMAVIRENLMGVI